MSANLRYYVAAMYELDRVIRQVPADRWDAPSPCDGWTARDVAGHAIAVAANIPAKLGLAEALDPFGDVSSVAGDDPAASFRPIKAAVLDALDRPGALQARIVSSFGDITLDEYLSPLARDAVIHAWDIARATGSDERLDPDLVDTTLARMHDPDMKRGAGRYDDAVTLPADAGPQDRLIALSGRAP